MEAPKEAKEAPPKEPEKDEEIHLDWPPLESDPFIFNEYFHAVGLKKEVYFKEMLSLVDYSALMSISGPVLGVLLKYSRNEKEKEESFPKENSVSYFMKQTNKLDNACGLIAALHCFGNAKNGQMKFEKDSALEQFFEKAKNLSPIERAKLLENDDNFKKAHKKFSKKGQTDLKTTVKNDYVGHYICFMNINGKLVEFDGIKDSPSLIKENIDDSNYLDETMKEILKRIEKNAIDERVNVMIVADPDTQLIDFLEEE